MHKIVIYILAIFLLTNINIAYSDDNLTRYYQAKMLISKGDYKSAITILENIVKIKPSLHIYKSLIESLLNDGQFDKAFTYSEELVKKNPENVEALVLAAGLLESYKRDYDKAFDYYGKAYAISGDKKYALLRVLIAEKKKDFNLGIDLLDELIKKEPENSTYYTYRGMFNYSLNKNSKAINDLKKSISINKDDVLAKSVLAEIYNNDGLYSKAIPLLEDIMNNFEYEDVVATTLAKTYIKDKKFDKAIELYKNLASKYTGKRKSSYLKMLAQLFYDNNEYLKAAGVFKEIIAEFPQDVESFMAAGKIYEYTKDYDNATDMYIGALKVDPMYAEGIKRLSVVYLLQDKPEYALKQLKYIDEVEQDVDYFLLSAEAYSLQKKYKEAADILEKGIKANPTNSIMLSFLGSVYFDLNEKNKALSVIKKAYKIEPENPVYLNFLGYLYAEMDMNLDEAKILIEKALKVEPDNAAYLDSLGWVYYKLNDYKKAFKYLKKAYEKEPKNDEIKNHYMIVKGKIN